MVESREKAVHRVIGECYSPVNEGKYLPHLLKRFDKAIKYSLEFLQDGELPEKVILVYFSYDDPNTPKNTEGFLWSTDNRIFYASSIEGFLQSPKPLYKELAYGRIATVQLEKGNFFSSDKIIFHTSTTSSTGYVAKVTFVSINEPGMLEQFADYVRNKIASSKTSNDSSQTSEIPNAEDLINRLERLGELKSQGLITEEEFVAAKKKLLD